MVRVSIVVPDASLTVHAHAFDEIVQTLVGSFARLGVQAQTTGLCAPSSVQTIVLAPHLQPPDALAQLPDTTILYNWEQLGSGGTGLMNDELAELMKRFIIWDYSSRNMKEWERRSAPRCVHVPIGYDPTLEYLPTVVGGADIDVLFYGSMNNRRAYIIRELQAHRIHVETLFGLYGAARDEAIVRAKIVLNMHYYESSILELPRLSFLWANRKPVVCEIGPRTEDYFDMRQHCLSADYGGLVSAVMVALHSPDDVERQTHETYEYFRRAADGAAIVRQALLRSAELTAAIPVPIARPEWSSGIAAPARWPE